jgi:putative membrane protein insertion efficiency factor
MKNILIFLIRAYQVCLSPAQTFLFGGGAGCRFTPTCSQFAAEAVEKHGVFLGTTLAAKRTCRCHPWGGGGHDPVPESGKRKTENEKKFQPAHS